MTVYNKLVRDRIPELIRAGGETPRTRILEDEEFHRLLEAKLDEEVGEFHRDRNLEELADIPSLSRGERQMADRVKEKPKRAGEPSDHKWEFMKRYQW